MVKVLNTISRKKSIVSIYSPNSDEGKVEVGPRGPRSGMSATKLKSLGEKSRLDTLKYSSELDDSSEFIKALIKRYKKLEVDLNKFKSKPNGVSKTNVLRTALLLYLRKNIDLEGVLGLEKKVYRSLANFLGSILIQWWNNLINNLISSDSSISAIDRSAYLECISKIISRNEWKVVDEVLAQQYNDCLVLTMEYSIQRFQTLKHFPLSICAFMGKVLAYCFFYIPKVANALLFLLNIKQSAFEKVMSSFEYDISPEDVKEVRSYFPNHLHMFINFQGIKSMSKYEKAYLNSVPPPQHPVRGIKDPKGLWVSKWFCSDSDIFNSFLGHYIHVLKLHLNDAEDLRELLFICPGFNLILCHTYNIFNLSISKISQNSTGKFPVETTFQDKEFNISQKNPRNSNIKQNDIYYNSIMKVFKTIRHISYTTESDINGQLVKFFDYLLVSIAKDTTIHDVNKNGLILDIIYQFANHSDADVDWEFWLNCNYMMINHTDHIQILLKNFAFLFNIWDLIPEALSTSKLKPFWFTEDSSSIKVNFINWFISNSIFERFLTHWHPIVRSYYLRLLVWRIVGFNSYKSSNTEKIKYMVEEKLRSSYRKLVSFDRHFKLNYKPDSPLVNRKIGIIPINSKDSLLYGEDNPLEFSSEYFPSSAPELRKANPFEILDESIYSCSSLPISQLENLDRSSRSNFVTSLSKIFKLLSDDEKEVEKSLLAKKKSHSSTSLSTYSANSTCSTPSLMSFRSRPTSLTDLSIISSQNSDFENKIDIIESTSELFKYPPDIIWPIHKFEILIDHESMNEKFFIVNNNTFLDSGETIFPNEPKLSSISILIDNDSNNKFYIQDEDLITPRKQRLQAENVFDLFSSLPIEKNRIEWTYLGKSLVELELVVDEFNSFLHKRIEIDRFNNEITLSQGFTEFNYFKKIIPYLPVDSITEFKLIQAG